MQRTWFTWALVIAYSPGVLFFGHWPALEIRVPGTDARFVLNLSESTSADHPHNQASTHEQHCHASGASCGSKAETSVAPAAHLREVVEDLVVGGMLIPLHGTAASSHGDRVVSPTPPPPRV